MNLITHDLKYLIFRFKWLIILWWLVVALIPITEGIDIDDLFLFLTLSGLGIFPLYLFHDISPHRETGTKRTLPISDKELIVTRILFLLCFVGPPFWIREVVHLATSVNAPISFIFHALIEKISFCGLYWLLFSFVGWYSKRLWHGVIVTYVAQLIFSGYPTVPNELNTKLETFINLATSSSTPFRETVLEILVGACFPIIGWLIGWRWNQGEQPWKQWAPVVTTFFLSYPGLKIAEKSHQELVRKVSTNSKLVAEIEQSVQYQLRPPNWRFTPYNGAGNKRWDVQATGRNFPSQISGFNIHSQGSWIWKNENKTINFKHSKIQNGQPAITVRPAILLESAARDLLGRSPQLIAQGLPTFESQRTISNELNETYFERPPDEVTALSRVEYSKLGKWVEIPTDGNRALVGNNFQFKFLKWREQVPGFLGVVLDCYLPTLPSKLTDNVLPNFWIGFWHEESNQWKHVNISLSYTSSYAETGALTASPKIRIYVNLVQSADFQNKANNERLVNRLKESRLFIIENRFVGQLTHELTANIKPDDRELLPANRVGATGHRVPYNGLNQIFAPKHLTVFQQAPGKSESEVRRWLYHLNYTVNMPTHSPESQRHVKQADFPSNFRHLLHQAAELQPAIFDTCPDIWNQDQDFDWLFALAKKGRPDFSHYLTKLGWLDDDKKLSEELLSNHQHFTSEMAKLAKKHELKQFQTTIKASQFTAKLNEEVKNIPRNVSQSDKDKFPEQWNEVESQHRNAWQALRPIFPYTCQQLNWEPAIGFARLSGNFEPIQEILQLVERGALAEAPFYHSTIYHDTVGKVALISSESIWPYLCRLLNQDDLEETDTRQRSQLAAQWLKSKWVFETETLTFRKALK